MNRFAYLGITLIAFHLTQMNVYHRVDPSSVVGIIVGVVLLYRNS